MVADDQRPSWRKWWRRVQPILIVTLLAVVSWLLYRELRNYSLSEVRDSFRAIKSSRLALSFGLMVFNYAILIGYDWLAVRSTGYPLAFRRLALASFAGFVTSYNFGALLGGTPVRIRLYSSWGMPPSAIVRMMVMIGMTFWFGVFALAGVMFVLDPIPVPARLQLPMSNVRPLGILLLGIVAVYAVVPLVWRKPLVLFGHAWLVPPLRVLIAQLIVAAADLIVAAVSLFILMPDALEISFGHFLSVYLLAVVAVIFTHVPGGVGVFELTILTLSGTAAKQGVLAALLAFRVIYYLLPLVATVALLSAREWRTYRDGKRAT